MFIARCIRAILLASLLVLCAACRQQQATSASDIALDLSPGDLRVGATTMTLRAMHKDGQPITQPGKASLRGDMNHAGMPPVSVESSASENGAFQLPFEWTMGGSWSVEARLELPNGEVVLQTFAYEIQGDGSAASEHDMQTGDANMDMEALGQSGFGSAAYMHITNRSAEETALVTAASDAAQSVSFHQTRVVDGLAQMMPMDELLVPGSGDVELAPGGMHLMLKDLKRDLRPGDSFEIELTDNGGRSYRLDFIVPDQPLTSGDDEERVHNLYIKQRWARPASAG